MTTFAVVALSGLAACDGPRSVPRIEPVLENWPSPYRGMIGVEVHAFNTGNLSIPEASLHRAGNLTERRTIDVPAFVITHPREGLTVFDTGLNPKAGDPSSGYLGGLQRGLSQPSTAAGQDLPSQMRAIGFDPADVKRVILSHMHFDHTGTVESFPNAKVIVARSEREGLSEVPLYRDYSVPADFDDVRDWEEVDFDTAGPVGTFSRHRDLFGDSSALLIDLSGHTEGSLGLLVRTVSGPILLVGDAAFVEESWRFASPPLIAADSDAWWNTVWRVKKFAQLEPSLTVIPGHDLSGVLEREVGEHLKVYRFTIDEDAG